MNLDYKHIKSFRPHDCIGIVRLAFFCLLPLKIILYSEDHTRGNSYIYYTDSRVYSSVSDPHSFNVDLDSAKNLKAEPVADVMFAAKSGILR